MHQGWILEGSTKGLLCEQVHSPLPNYGPAPLSYICYRPQMKFAKVMFSQVSVHIGGVLSQSHCMLGYTPPSTGQTPPLLGRHPPAQCMLGDTVNKRVVRIPLECILVCNVTTWVPQRLMLVISRSLTPSLTLARSPMGEWFFKPLARIGPLHFNGENFFTCFSKIVSPNGNDTLSCQKI